MSLEVCLHYKCYVTLFQSIAPTLPCNFYVPQFYAVFGGLMHSCLEHTFVDYTKMGA